MQKIFFYTLLFIILSFSNLNAAEVNKVEIIGNDRVSKETIFILGDINLNENYTESRLNKVLKNLYETKFFSNVSLELDKNVLKIFVTENPIIKTITMSGVKAKKHKNAINDMLSLKEKSSFIENYLINDVEIIKKFFQDVGYYFCEVEVYKKKNDNNTIDIVYEVILNEKVQISKIYFLGDKKFKDRKLRQIITSEESKFWKFISTSKYVNEKRINLDRRLLENFYRNKGYYEVKINTTNATFNENDTEFFLTYNIDSGKRYIFNNINITLPDSVDKSYYTEVFEYFENLQNKYYSLSKVKKIFDKLENVAANNSLVFLETKLNETLKEDKIDLEFVLVETKKLFVERINIYGNSITSETVLRSELELDEGDPFNELLLTKSINNIKGRNLFGSVKSNTTTGSTQDLREINIEVEEKATGEITAGAGFGSEGGQIAFSVAENNWLGSGRKVEAALSLSEEKITGRLTIDDPNFKFSGNALRTTIESTNINKMTNYGYESTKTGFSFGTTFEQYDNIYVAADLSTYYESLSTNTSASDSLKKQKGNYLDTIFGYALISDTRNQVYQTTEGSRMSFSQAIPIYSKNPSISHGVDAISYYAFNENLIGSARFFSRTINPLGSKDVKISDRIFIPARFLRGFEPGKIGPKDGADFVGGNYAAALSFSLAVSDIFSQLQNTDFSLFFDAANLWHVDYDKTLPESDSLRSAFGVGVNWYSPIGPISLSFAQDLSSDDTDVPETFRFNIGTTF